MESKQLVTRAGVSKVIFTLLAALLFISVGVVVPRIPCVELDWSRSGFGTSGGILLAVNLGLIVSVLLLRPNRPFDLFEPLHFMLFLFFMVFVARPLQILLRSDARVYGMPDDPLLIQTALGFGALGLVSFFAGYASRAGPMVARAFPSFGWPWQHPRVVWVSMILLTVGFAGYAIAIVRTGGVGAFLGTLQGRSLLEQSGSWVFASTVVLIHSATIILGSYVFKTGRLKLFFMVSLLLSAGMSVLLGGRSTVMIYLLSLVVIFYYLRYDTVKRSFRSIVIIGLFVIASVVFVVSLGSARTSLERSGEIVLSTGSVIRQVVDQFISEFGQFDWMVIVEDLVPKTLPYQKGVTFLHLFTQAIPRAIWPAKPDPIEYTITWLVHGVRSGSPFTIIGELFLNFKIPGIVVGMLIFGILARALYSYLGRHRDDPGVVLLYGYTYANLLHFFTRSFAPMMFSYVLFMVPTLCALWFIRPKRTD
jgi:oligosaccharide repeat unit polymerase